MTNEINLSFVQKQSQDKIALSARQAMVNTRGTMKRLFMAAMFAVALGCGVVGTALVSTPVQAAPPW
jgi:hypothetical protein